MSILIHILANSAAILAASFVVPGFIFEGSWQELLIAGAVLGIINSFIRPAITLLAFPIVFLTLGLFTVIINIALLMLADRLISPLEIRGFWAAFFGIIIISLVNHIILAFTKKSYE